MHPHSDSRHVVVIGGGAIGSSIAAFTLADPAFRGRVTVIERDPTYARASSALSASSIRQQFSTEINVRIGQYGIAFLRDIGRLLAVGDERPDVGLVEPGYLFLATPPHAALLRDNHALQTRLGASIELLAPDALARRFPWLAVDDVALGAHGVAGEGWFDGYALLSAFRRKARSLGATYVSAEATGFDRDGERITAAVLGDGARVTGDVFVNAGGPWARRIAAWAGVDLPVQARRRSVFMFESPEAAPGCPLVIDPSGAWFRPEGRGFICGISPDPANDPDEAPLDVEPALFEDVLWPTLARRVPGFEALRQTRAWAGYYEMNTFDANGIVGGHPAVRNLVFANGFSGHGIQQSPAVGRGVAELLVHGGYRTLDLSPLGFDRILAGRPLLERNVV
jgi:glycine/D-amino acid oxidase-like deaminating enzyme